MKKIINNLLYDTDISYFINEYYDYQRDILSSYSISESLFLTKNNRFFIHRHETELILFNYQTYDDIIALSSNEAYEYMKKYCPEKIKKYFKIEDA